MQQFPNRGSAFVDALGKILKPWVQYIQQFTIAPPNAIEQDGVGTFVAAEPGFLYVKGAASIKLIRGSLELDFTGAITVPVSVADQVITTGNITPYFFPSYGASTQT